MGAKESRINNDQTTRRNVHSHPRDPHESIPPPPPRSSRTNGAPKKRQNNQIPPPPQHARQESSHTLDNPDNNQSFLSNFRRKWSSHQVTDVEPRETPRRTTTAAPVPTRRSLLASFFGRNQAHNESGRPRRHTDPEYEAKELDFTSSAPLPTEPTTSDYIPYYARASISENNIAQVVPSPTYPSATTADGDSNNVSLALATRFGPVDDIGHALANLDAAQKEAERVFDTALRRRNRKSHSGFMTAHEHDIADSIIHDVVYAYNVWHQHAGLLDRDVQGHVANLRHNLDVFVAYLRCFPEFQPLFAKLPGAISGLGGSVTPTTPHVPVPRFSSDSRSPPFHARSTGSNEEVEEADVEGVVSFINEQLQIDPHGVPRHPTYTYWDFKKAIRETKCLLDQIVQLLEVGLGQRRATFNPLWVYLCSTALDKQSQERRELSREIKEITCTLMSECKGVFTHEQRRFLKFCLAFCYPQRYDDLFYHLQEVARGIVCELQLPLVQYYAYMKEHDSLLLDLEVPADFLYGGSKKPRSKQIQSQRDVLPASLMQDLDEWYQRERLTAENEQKSIKFYEKWGFATKRIEKLRMKDGHAHGGRIVLNMFKQIAEELRPSFQHFMAHLYAENLSKFNYDQMMPEMDGFMPDDDKLYDVCGARAPCVKSISRALHKAVREFGTHPDPREAFILSYLRSVIVFRTERELNSFFQMLLKVFKGKIINFFNGFSRDEVVLHENNVCRVVTMHVLYEHPNKKRSGCGRQMIVEIQMLLSRFFVVHRQLHLYHKVVRAKEQWAIGRDFSKMWDL